MQEGLIKKRFDTMLLWSLVASPHIKQHNEARGHRNGSLFLTMTPPKALALQSCGGDRAGTCR